MRRIAIVGSGQAGLLTAHGLLQAGYDVTLFSDKTPEQWLNESRPTGTAGRFDPALSYERELGLNFWEKEAPPFEGVHLVFCLQPRTPFITLSGRFPRVGMAIDLRLQSHRWMLEFSKRGGKLVIETISLERLDELARTFDLVVVASGRGLIADLFPRNEARSVYNQPQRNLAMVVTRCADMNFPNLPFRPVKFNFIATDGEAFWVPYYHKTHGATWNLVFEAKPGGLVDQFGGVKTGEDALNAAKKIIRDVFPWDAKWAEKMELADDYGWLVGKFSPAVRHPVGRLSSGRIVTCVGDTAMAFDPIAGQGANNGNRMARHLVESIVARGSLPFDAAWMETTFDHFYNEYGKAAYTFTNLFLEPIPDAGKELLIAQYGSDGRTNNAKQAIADAFCANFEDPRQLTHVFSDMTAAREFIAKTTGKSWVWSAARGRFSVIRDQVRQKMGYSLVG